MSPTEQSALRPLPGLEDARNAGELLQDFSMLMRQLGSPELLYDLPFAAGALREDKLDGIAGLSRFLEDHQARVLIPMELPTIARACACAAQGQSGELIRLDQQLAQQPLPEPFATASRRVGRCQLERLRPLRGERTVQRYQMAVDSGSAQGWHTVVYGLTLAVYSWPLRQGLLFYGRQTLAVLAQAAARSQSMSELACGDLLEPLFARLPQAVERAIGEFELR